MLASEIPLPRASSRPLEETERVDDRSASAREQLSRVKRRVPEVQTRIGHRRWGHIVNLPSAMERMNRERVVINRAYHKMHEIALSCALRPVATSLHLCEAPGGFVQCTSDHLRSETGWTWRAVTLRDGVPLSPATVSRTDGAVLFADVLTEQDRVASEVAEAFPNGVELVTADGATVMQHENMEEEHYPLAVAQVRIALRCLAANGVLVLKLFECLHPRTRDVIAALTQCFDSVSLIKPGSSRPTNSERYLVCRVFDGCTRTLDGGACVHADGWMTEYTHAVDSLASQQTSALERVFASV